jgi:hypothetical protein
MCGGLNGEGGSLFQAACPSHKIQEDVLFAFETWNDMQSSENYMDVAINDGVIFMDFIP